MRLWIVLRNAERRLDRSNQNRRLRKVVNREQLTFVGGVVSVKLDDVDDPAVKQVKLLIEDNSYVGLECLS